MPISASILRPALIVFFAGVWVLSLAALNGASSETGVTAVALVGAALVALRGGAWIPVGAGAALTAGSLLTLGTESVALTLALHMSGTALVTVAGLRLVIRMLRSGDEAVRSAWIGIAGFLAVGYAVVNGAPEGGLPAAALVAPAAALLPLAYAAWGSLLHASPATARRESPRAASAMMR